MALTVLVVNTADAAMPNSSSCTPGDRRTSVAACIQVNKRTSTSTDELARAALRYNRANAFLQEGQIDAAVRYYTEAIGLQPNFALAYLNRGIAYAQEALLGQSLSDLNEAVQLDPSSSKPFYNRGICYSKMGQFALAVADFQRVRFVAIPQKPRPLATGGTPIKGWATGPRRSAISAEP